jgi:hypothetical protein
MKGFAYWIIRTSETDGRASAHVNVHRFAAGGTSGSFFDFQSSFTGNKLPIADLALVALLAVFCFAELINCV